jgi:hypothetical protein
MTTFKLIKKCMGLFIRKFQRRTKFGQICVLKEMFF